MYIYLAEKDNFSCVPPTIMRSLGIADFSMELELFGDKKLAREDVTTVIKNLETKGFHLQLPGNTSIEQIMTRIARGKS
jgi:hypothetical protein